MAKNSSVFAKFVKNVRLVFLVFGCFWGHILNLQISGHLSKAEKTIDFYIFFM